MSAASVAVGDAGNIQATGCPAPPAFEDALRSVDRYLWQLARRMTRHEDGPSIYSFRTGLDTEDVHAALCAELARQLPRYDARLGKLTTFIAGNVARRVRNRFRYYAEVRSGPACGSLAVVVGGKEVALDPADRREGDPAAIAAARIDAAAVLERVRAAELPAADVLAVEAALRGEPVRLTHGAKARLREVLADLEPVAC